MQVRSYRGRTSTQLLQVFSTVFCIAWTAVRETLSSFPTTIMIVFPLILFRSNRTLWLPKTNAESSTILRDKLNSGLFECGDEPFPGLNSAA